VTTSLATVEDLRTWATAPAVPDAVLSGCLDDAESSLLADLGLDDTTEILADPRAMPVARGETLRRGQRFLARRNSPEGIAGTGDFGGLAISFRDPDSVAALDRLRQLLMIPYGIA